MPDLEIEALSYPLRQDTDGVIRVGPTRVTLDTVVAAFRQGATAEEIRLRYPAVELADVYEVIGYYLRHRAVVDGYLEMRGRDAAEARRRNEALLDPQGMRDRLLARRTPS